MEWADSQFVQAMVECDIKDGFVTMGRIMERFNVLPEVIEPAQARLGARGVIEGGDCHCCCIWFTDGTHPDSGLNVLVDWDDHQAVAAAMSRALA